MSSSGKSLALWPLSRALVRMEKLTCRFGCLVQVFFDRDRPDRASPIAGVWWLGSGTAETPFAHKRTAAGVPAPQYKSSAALHLAELLRRNTPSKPSLGYAQARAHPPERLGASSMSSILASLLRRPQIRPPLPRDPLRLGLAPFGDLAVVAGYQDRGDLAPLPDRGPGELGVFQ